MDNSNFWDWDNEDEHRISSVYRDADVENVKAQNSISQNNVGRSADLQSNAASNDIGQDAKEEKVVLQTNTSQGVELQNNVIHNVEHEVIHNVEHDAIQSVSDVQTNAESSGVVTENNFILVDNPQDVVQNTTPQAESLHTQMGYQQTDGQPTDSQRINYQQTMHRQAENQQNDYQQNGYQQNDFQQIIPVQNTQQNQSTNKQKAKQNKNIDYSSNYDQKDISENKVSAMAAYLLGPVGIIIALLIARDSAYTAFHVRQALKVTICSVVLEIIAAILALFAMIPLVGIIFKLVLIIIVAIWFGVLVLRLIAIAQVCDGEAREPAVIGRMNCFH